MKLMIMGTVATTAAVLATFAPVAHAAAATKTVTVRQGDFISALSDTRPAGHVDFLKEGLHVYTDDATSNAKAAEYFPVAPQGLPASVDLTWFGTDAQPGSQIVFDADGDSSTSADRYNVLVGEPVYNGDYWLSTSSSIYKLHHDQCPDTSGGSGTDCHGTLAQWQQAFPDAKVYAAGFSLGSGIKGDGVIRDIQVGDTDYQFTSEPAITTVPVTGNVSANEVVRRHATVLSLYFSTDALGTNQAQGKKLTFKVTDNGQVVFRDRMGADETSFFKQRFVEGSGKHKIQVLENGAVDRTFKINMGR
jgi:hypothetical protein